MKSEMIKELMQDHMATQFCKSKKMISEHIRNIFTEGELDELVVIRKFRTTTQHSALAAWPQIDFIDDRDGCLFTATVHRKPVAELALASKDALKGQIKGQPDLINDLINVIRANPSADYPSLAQALEVSEATVKRRIQKLKQQNILRRVGSRKTGHWEVVE